jgi:hypothetical protein
MEICDVPAVVSDRIGAWYDFRKIESDLLFIYGRWSELDSNPVICNPGEINGVLIGIFVVVLAVYG